MPPNLYAQKVNVMERDTKFRTITTKSHLIQLTDEEAGKIESFLYDQIQAVKSHNVPVSVIEFQQLLKKGITLNKPAD